MATKLGLAQASALLHLFESYDTRTGFEAFVAHQEAYYSRQCAVEMINRRDDLARESAYYVRCYSTMLSDLKEFAKQQIEQR